MVKLDPDTLSRVYYAAGEPVAAGEYFYRYDTNTGNIFRAPKDEVGIEWIDHLGRFRDSWTVVSSTRARDNVPVYPHTKSYAAVHNEEALWRRSHSLDSSCSGAIEQVIVANGDGYHLGPDSAELVIANFGLERTNVVLANIARQDKHASKDVRAWANAELTAHGVDVNDGLEWPIRGEDDYFMCVSTAELSDFISMVQAQREKTHTVQKPSLRDMLHAAKQERDAEAPKQTHTRGQDLDR